MTAATPHAPAAADHSHHGTCVHGPITHVTTSSAMASPQVHRSFCLDGAHTGRYWTFVSEELPEIVHRFFRVSRRREDTFVAGLSMGGYGAFRLALHHPERFAAAASLSGMLDLAGLRHDAGARRADGRGPRRA